MNISTETWRHFEWNEHEKKKQSQSSLKMTLVTQDGFPNIVEDTPSIIERKHSFSGYSLPNASTCNPAPRNVFDIDSIDNEDKNDMSDATMTVVPGQYSRQLILSDIRMTEPDGSTVSLGYTITAEYPMDPAFWRKYYPDTRWGNPWDGTNWDSVLFGEQFVITDFYESRAIQFEPAHGESVALFVLVAYFPVFGKYLPIGNSHDWLNETEYDNGIIATDTHKIMPSCGIRCSSCVKFFGNMLTDLEDVGACDEPVLDTSSTYNDDIMSDA
ncbi:hypothetical protein SEMRO_783_G201850.1 [Seminavis robusta]|uniref:Uncharacterized protein n=1 Tax=Seminavis robusta TaxID=568900 RepID=A0A9N8E806_9STRA|nr:hypothetical protein SEMRO_783_G201850.1 [Seminavis robusta]|eukprot:Sro783_g201850.1 n/a (271) ;mRNA; f:7911-8723